MVASIFRAALSPDELALLAEIEQALLLGEITADTLRESVADAAAVLDLTGRQSENVCEIQRLATSLSVDHAAGIVRALRTLVAETT